MPSANGRPLPVCKACQTDLEANPRPRSKARSLIVGRGLLGALGAMSVGLLLSSIFATRG